MRNTKIIVTAALAALALPGSAQQNAPATAPMAPMAPMAGAAGTSTSGTLSAGDKLFIVRAADGNMAEIMTSQMALKKAANGEVKQVAQTLITEHGQSQTELTQLAQQKGVALPPTVGPTHQVISQALMSARGGKFDQMFMGAQVDDHENTIALFQQEIASGQDPDVKAFAAKYLPGIITHTAMIYGAAQGVGVPAMRFRPSTPPAAGMPMPGMTGGTAAPAAGTPGQ